LALFYGSDIQTFDFLFNFIITSADKTSKNYEGYLRSIRPEASKMLGLDKEKRMGIQNWSEDIILVDLPQEPEMGDELKTVIEMVRDRGDCDVVIDFSAVDIITSSSLSKVLKLRKLLGDCGHRLIFCSVAPATKGIFTVTGLDGIFEVADDKFVALASLQMVG
jgi:anti-anti-sigma factor